MKLSDNRNGKTIRISDELYNKLAKKGNLTDSFNSVIEGLLQIDKEEIPRRHKNDNIL